MIPLPSDLARAREIVEALRAVPRIKIETPRCMGCCELWNEVHEAKHEELAARYPDEIIPSSKQNIYHYERDTDAEIAMIAAALAALREEEREACAQLAEGMIEPEDGSVDTGRIWRGSTMRIIAGAIRAPRPSRGEVGT